MWYTLVRKGLKWPAHVGGTWSAVCTQCRFSSTAPVVYISATLPTLWVVGLILTLKEIKNLRAIQVIGPLKWDLVTSDGKVITPLDLGIWIVQCGAMNTALAKTTSTKMVGPCIFSVHGSITIENQIGHTRFFLPQKL